MHDKICKLVLFRPEESDILARLAALLAEPNKQPACLTALTLQLRRMVELSEELNLHGNLWHNYLTWFLLTNENPFTLDREYRTDHTDLLSRLARQDLEIFRQLFETDLSSPAQALGLDCFDDLEVPLRPAVSGRGMVGALVSDMAKKLAAAPDTDAFYKLLTDHYAQHGVGIFGMGHAFRIDQHQGVSLKPIYNEDPVMLDDLVGYDEQKNQLVRNTLAFLEGKPANNVLLYGDSGSGKSTCIRALLHEYYPKGLRLIELYKHQFQSLAEVIGMVKERNCKFLLFIDDLSFEDFEIEYKFFKAVIEGGIEARPDNLLIYATSNRRHLIKETWNDRSDMEHNGDIHRSDTLEEKLSLANRFGLAINFSSPNRKQYHEIVKTLADRAGIIMDEAELFRKADAWEIRHGGVSGRAARQFINDLLCTTNH